MSASVGSFKGLGLGCCGAGGFAGVQGLTLVHFSAQRKHFLCDRECM